MRAPLWSPTMSRLPIMRICIHGYLILFGGLISGFLGSLSWQILTSRFMDLIMDIIMDMGTMVLSPIISAIPEQAGYPALSPQTDFAAVQYGLVHPLGPGVHQGENSGAMGLLKTLPGPAQVPLSTLSTANLSMQRVTADSKAAQVPARLLVEVMGAEVPGSREGVPAALEAEDSMAEAEGSTGVVDGVNRLLIFGGKSHV